METVSPFGNLTDKETMVKCMICMYGKKKKKKRGEEMEKTK
jgi:hypothetical protein